MRTFALLATLLFSLCAATAVAQQGGQPADHDALRKLKNDVLNAINARDLASMDRLLHKPFVSTVITQDSFNDAGPLKAWFEDLFKRPFLRITRIQMDADADELAQIYNGTFAVARGSTREHYELADGRGFDMQGRWTATAIKENDRWTVVAVHSGINFLDNPVINAIERNSLMFAAGGGAIGGLFGLGLGFLLAFVIRRRRARTA